MYQDVSHLLRNLCGHRTYTITKGGKSCSDKGIILYSIDSFLVAMRFSPVASI